LIIPATPLDGANLIAASDLVISAGERSIVKRRRSECRRRDLCGQWAAVDEELLKREGCEGLRTLRICAALSIEKKQELQSLEDRVG
jgi:hypothetical protein